MHISIPSSDKLITHAFILEPRCELGFVKQLNLPVSDLYVNDLVVVIQDNVHSLLARKQALK